LEDYEIDMISGTSAVLKSIPSVDWSINLSPYLSVSVDVVVDRLLQEWTTLSSQQRTHIKETSAQVSEAQNQLQRLTEDNYHNEEDEEWPGASDDFQDFTANTAEDDLFEEFGDASPPKARTNRSSRGTAEIQEWLRMEDEMVEVLDMMRKQYISAKTANKVNK
jgi:hypothetical protein